jgi:hypothetical protein
MFLKSHGALRFRGFFCLDLLCSEYSTNWRHCEEVFRRGNLIFKALWHNKSRLPRREDDGSQ